jgi:hypothetical protein
MMQNALSQSPLFLKNLSDTSPIYMTCQGGRVNVVPAWGYVEMIEIPGVQRSNSQITTFRILGASAL